MGWWSRLWPTAEGAVPNTTVGTPPSVGPGYSPGDPNGVEIVTPEPADLNKRMAAVVPSQWDGWPAGWAAQWSGGSSQLEDLVDTAWDALDLNSSVLSAMPVYRTKDGKILEPTTWMTNPDPSIYSGWPEFAKQLFWDFMLGEAFVLPMARGSDDWPSSFRVVPPPYVNVEMVGGRRQYKIGALDVTDEILHVRYKSRTDAAHGIGPLESGRTRLIAAATLMRYATELAEGGGIPRFILETDRPMNRTQAEDLAEQWYAARMQHLGDPWRPAVASGGVKGRILQFSPEQMALLDLTRFNEARIAVKLGVPPVALALPSGQDSMTYNNITMLFDFHDRAGLKPKVAHVMSALSGWALPRGQSVELNRDEYTRPPLLERAQAYEKLAAIPGVIKGEQIATMERFTSPEAAVELTGGD